jgi:hypothetical protein
MIAIGFANIMFTLWDVNSETMYREMGNSHVPSGERTTYTYMGQLAKDEDRAIEKAKSRGCTNLVVNYDLKGSRSYSSYSTGGYEQEEKIVDDTIFNYGKYRDQKISESTDVDYMAWYSRTNPNIIERVMELSNDYMVVDGELLSKTQAIYEDIIYGRRKVVATSNFQSYEYQYAYVKAELAEINTELDEKFMQEHPYGIKLEALNVIELNLKMRYYNGYEYYVPSGMRSFKKKEFTINNGVIKF